MTIATVTGYGLLGAALIVALVDLVRPMPGASVMVWAIVVLWMPLLERPEERR